MDQGLLCKTLLHTMKDAVTVCDGTGKILLCNRAAESLFGPAQDVFTGKSLYGFCLQAPVVQALNLLRHQHNRTGDLPAIQFLNASVNQERFFRCQASFLPGPEADPAFVVIFEDISAWHIPDNPLFLKVEEFRSPLTNLRAAVENLTEYPEMSPVMRSAFENVLVQESLHLIDAFKTLASSCRAIMQTQNHLAELDTAILFSFVADHLRQRHISVVAEPGSTAVVKVDIYGLLLLLDFLVSTIVQQEQDRLLSCQAHCSERFAYFDLVWSGPFISTAAVEKMMAKKLEHSIGRMTVASILRSMDGDIWSQQHEHAKSMLRLALPASLKSDPAT